MNPKVDAFLSKAKKWQDELGRLRKIALSCELTEELKWGKPCYTFQESNVITSFYLAPSDAGYRVEAIYEHDAWRNDARVQTPTWRLGKAASGDEAIATHMSHLEREAA